MNGKTVEVDNTDAEGRLILAGAHYPITKIEWRCMLRLILNLLSDALYYASTEYKPHTLVDVATLTGYVLAAYHAICSNVDIF